MKKHNFKKLISVFLAVVMIVGLMAYLPGGFIQVSAATIDYSGKCGENLTWELNGSTNKLTIRGRGEMYNYTPENSAPWGTYISEVDISPYVTSIGDYAFYGFYNMTSLTIPNGVTSIGKYAFAGYSGLTSITIPSSVKSIGYSAFENCLSLTRVNTTNIAAWCEIVFSNSYSNPLSYAHSLYLNSNAVKNLVLPEDITKLNDYVFYGFSGLVSVTIPDDVLSIGAYAFYGCDHLTNVTIPSSVMSIGNSAFEGCSALAWVNTTDVVSWCGTVFGNYYSNPLNYAHGFYLNSNIVKDLIIPDGVTRINAYAFFGCTGLTSIMIPESVTDIGVYAFHYYDYYWGDDPRPLDATLKVYKDSYAQRYAVNNQFEYEVQKRLQRIEVTMQPTKTSYIKGETLDVSGGRITLYYDNGSSETIAISSSMVSGFDSGVVGTQTLTVTYNGRTAFFNVTVVGDAVKGMVITSAPTKTVYQVGETLALNGCKVRITYNSGAVRTARIIDEAGVYKIVFDDNSERDTITVSGYNRLKNGNQTITISYSGVSASFIIEMNGTAPKGDPDCDGQITVADALVALRVAAKLSESSPEMVACCDTDGDGHITVADALAILRVAAKLAPPFDLIILVRIAVTTLPSKTSYISGEALDITGCKITLYYSDGSSEIVAVSDSMVSGFNSSTTGTKTITVTYEGKTATFTITVVAKSITSIAVTTKPTKTSYVVGQSLDVTGGKITAYYNDGSSSVVNMTASMVSGFNSSTTGTKTLTVTYNGKTATFTVTVIAKALTNIAITTNPTKTSYVVGETLDVTGGKITAYYNDGSSEVINMTASMVSGFNSSTAGTKTLTVAFSGKTTSFSITIIVPGVDPSQDAQDAFEAAYYAALTYWRGNYTPTSYEELQIAIEEANECLAVGLDSVICADLTERLNAAVAGLVPITSNTTVAPTQATDSNGNPITVKLFSTEDFSNNRDMSRANGHRSENVGYDLTTSSTSVDLPAKALRMTATAALSSKHTDLHGAMQFKLINLYGNSITPDVNRTEDGNTIGGAIGDLSGSAGIRLWVGVNDVTLAQNATFGFGVANITEGPLFESWAVNIPFPATGSGWIYIPWECFDYCPWSGGVDINLAEIRFWIVRIDGEVPQGLEVYVTSISAYTNPSNSVNATPVISNVTDGQIIDVYGYCFVPKWDIGTAELNGKRYILGTEITVNGDYTLIVTNGNKKTTVVFKITGGQGVV